MPIFGIASKSTHIYLDSQTASKSTTVLDRTISTGESSVNVFASKGVVPKYTATSSGLADWYIPVELQCPIYEPGGDAPFYILFKDPILQSCGPGGCAVILAKANEESDTTIWYMDGSRTSHVTEQTTGTYISSHSIIYETGSKTSITTIESFNPIMWAIPEPYSIRNIPQTNIWLRLQNPTLPLNLDSLIFKVNGQTVTDSVIITLIPDGVELLFNPPEDFNLSQRVYVDIYITASPSKYFTLANDTYIGTEYIKVNESIDLLQPGAVLQIGPNPDGDYEINNIRAIVAQGELLVKPLEYEYTLGDNVTYTYTDYPLNIDYWFDIVEDFRPPVFSKVYPTDGQTKVVTDQIISFDITDVGEGVDIDSLIFTVNNMVVYPNIYKWSNNHYFVSYSPVIPFYFNVSIECFATVTDLSKNANRGTIVWKFTTEESELPMTTNAKPTHCAYPVHLNDHVQLDIYGRGGGINEHTIELTVDDTESEFELYPKIYRNK
jgi:hypothetical protein